MHIRIYGIRGLPSTYSGFETIMSELGPRWVEAGHEVTLYCRKSAFEDRPPSWKGVELVYLPSIEHKVASTLSHGLFCTLHAMFAPSDIVLVWNAANGPFGWLLRLAAKKAVINVDGMEWLRPKWQGAAKRYFRWAALMATRAFHAVVTDANEMKRLYLQEFGVETTYIAYGANIEPPSSPEIPRQYGLEPDGYYLIASRLIPDNNADLIVQAFVKSGSHKQLAIAGGADYRGNSIEAEFIAKLKRLANDRVRFLGHIDSSEHIKDLHHHCFAYIHGHQYGGINPSLLKALGYGNCVLAHNTPFNREVLSDGKYGILWEKDTDDLCQALQYVERHPQVVEALRRQANEPIIERFNWERIAQEYIELFQRFQPSTRET